MDALADLGTYPAWLGLVTAAEPDGDNTWVVTLRARLGPLARSKRLRMVRTERSADSVRFERREVDGRDHSEWVLSAGHMRSSLQVASSGRPAGSRFLHSCEVVDFFGC